MAETLQVSFMQKGGFDSHTAHHIIKNIITMNKPTKAVRVSAGTRVYYFDAHKDKNGHPYVSISEIPTDRNPGKVGRKRIFVHAEDIDKFSAAFSQIANHVKNDS